MADAVAATDPATHARAAGLDPARLPRHVALIMDGNGRWAKKRGWERFLGHRHGADTLRTITSECVHLGIARLTVYAFSSENWQRPAREVAYLMDLLAEFLRSEVPRMQENGVRLEAIGQLHRLPAHVRDALSDALRMTAANTGTVLTLALSYGGRDELVDACRAIAAQAARGEIDPAAIDAGSLRAALYTAHDVDVVIRTAGESRVSNFLPWQAAYAEFITCQPLWPDFTVADFLRCLVEYQGRERRFGLVAPG
ncbi:MAG: di-trans,poly-cis-decaprenylcistransferase [Planctomycetes bacterium]|nr:di-trans,poly-cis-decaprenylcistransferase [Planctomycetota bacterium]